MLSGFALAMMAACTNDTATQPEMVAPLAATVSASRVSDLSVVAATDSSIEVRWTEVSDGKNRPALYRLKFDEPSIDWTSATIGCQVQGTSIGSPIGCTIGGLKPSTKYEFLLMSYRVTNHIWQGATYSNVAGGETLASGSRGVTDLAVTGASTSTLSLRWTQVDDGTGNPARYRVKFAAPPIAWSSAAIGCDVAPTDARIGAPTSCTVSGLAAGGRYDVQLMSYRVADGVWHDAEFSNVATGDVLRNADPVTDLAVNAATDSTLTVRWTEVSDGQAHPAWYRVRFGQAPFSWSTATATCGTEMAGTSVGAQRSCTIRGLSADASYSVQVMSYANVDGVVHGEVLSNVAAGRTTAPSPSQLSSSTGIWISPAEIAKLPMSGAAWNNVQNWANRSCGTVDLSDQEQSTNVCILAKALVFAKTGTASYRTAVVTAISQIVSSGTYNGRALSLGRELGAYVVAADLIDLKTFNPTLDASFRAKLRVLRTTYTEGAAANLIDCHEKRPNNWGAHCGATRVAIAVYLGDTADLERTARVFHGYLGDRSAYAGFDYGDDLSWQCDPTRPVGINPEGCRRYGVNLDGVLPDDQRRAGVYTWPAPDENYVWEALQGLLAQAVILHRAGYPVWDWQNRALLRAVRWVNDVNAFAAVGDDTWLPHIVNRYYGTNFAETTPSVAGKNFGFTDWTLP